MSASWNDFNDAQNTVHHAEGHDRQGAPHHPPGRLRRPGAGLDRRLCHARRQRRRLPQRRIHRSRRPVCPAQDLHADRPLQPEGPGVGEHGPRPDPRHPQLGARHLGQGHLAAGAGGTPHQRLPGPRRHRVPRPRRRRRGRQRRSEERDPQGDHPGPPGLRQVHGRSRRSGASVGIAPAAAAAPAQPKSGIRPTWAQ